MAVILVAALAGFSSAASASTVQRMVLAPAGCRVLAPGASLDAAAYCLDQTRTPPSVGSLLPDVLASLDGTVVERAGAPPLTLSQALARHMVQVEGRGDDHSLRIRNLADIPLELCIEAPTVVMAAGEGRTRDLSRVRDRLTELLRRDHGSPASHVATQQRLWSLVKESERAEASPETQALAPPRKPGSAPPTRRKCVGRTDKADLELCVQ